MSPSPLGPETATPQAGLSPEYRLDDRYCADSGTVFLTGIQALARLPLEQLRIDHAQGRNTAAFISGYPGSPLGGYDKAIAQAAKLAMRSDPRLNLVCQPALNEEYAASAVMGSQLAAGQSDARYDGVLGVWYGKAPGVDRASDALRHAVYAGSHPLGGAIALVGDDPNAKSSTLPSSSAGTLFDMHIPVLYPGDPGEALDLGRHAIALARCTGLWASLKIVADVADGSATVLLDPERVQPKIPLYEGKPYVHVPDGRLLTPRTLELEREIYEVRYALATEYASANQLNPTPIDPPSAWIGIVSSGISYREVREALRRLGLDSDRAIAAAGIRLLKMQMPMPFNPDTLRHFSRGLDEIFVIEEKSPNLESLIKAALYNHSEHPLVVGKFDEDDGALVAGYGALAADDILPALRKRLTARVGEKLAPEAPTPPLSAPLEVRRTPFYCSGCPHNRSTEVPKGAKVAAGIGCHTMALLMNPQRVGEISMLTCMGNEGTQWIGMHDFVERDHLIQNLGDGTYFHSGQLAVQAAVAAGVSITYKLLWNGAVAMTGGQEAQGRIPLLEVVNSLLAQGVARVLVTSDETERYAEVALPPGVEVWDRTRIVEAQELLAQSQGVSVLIHDQECAAELRRARKRGLAPKPKRRIAINPRICEGCGDCGRVSSCLSVQPIDTPFGRKTTIDQGSCNFDESCLEGDCPSFMTIEDASEASAAPKAPDTPLPELPDLEAPALSGPAEDVEDVAEFSLRITGVGGTGVVTVSQVLGTAAAFDGYEVRGLDQIGLSQKAGPVVSDLRLGRGEAAATNRIGRAQADLILAFDPLVGASESGLSVADPARSAVVGSTSCAPTGAMIINPEIGLPSLEEMRARIARVTCEERAHWADAAARTTALFGDAQTANLFVVGMAVQAGELPLRAGSIEKAIELNGVAVEKNRLAFAWGRTQVAHPEWLDAQLSKLSAEPAADSPPLRAQQLPDSLRTPLDTVAAQDARLRARLEELCGELIAFQSSRLAAQFLKTLESVAEAERAALPGSSELCLLAAESLYKLLAYKDEYEVARLMLDEGGLAPARAAASEGAQLYWQLHPPLLRAWGLERKLSIRMTPGTRRAVRALSRLRVLRGTFLDPFGYAELRRTERQLPREFCELVQEVMRDLKPEKLDAARSLLRLPLTLRGYEDLKLARVREYRARLQDELENYRRR